MFKGKCVKLFAAVLVLGFLSVGLITGCEIEEAQEGFTGDIIGIDPGAGLMSASEDAIEAYELDVNLIEGSDATMTAALSDAIQREEWIIVTGWAPHWKFAEWDLKFLDDPKEVFGGEEYIANIGRLGLAEDKPEAYHVLENFKWGDDEIGAVMDMNASGGEPEDNARTWVDENQDLVQEWIPEEVGDELGTFEIFYVEWECALASTFVVAAVLEDLGYEVNTTSVSASLMYESLAAGDCDAITTAWLPGTHGHYVEDYEGELDEIGVSYEGARIGWVVPAYVDVDSMEEINENIIE